MQPPCKYRPKKPVRRMRRIAFAAAVGLTLGEMLGWDFPFLPAMLAVQLLSGGGPISVKQGFGSSP
jgi:hypothetical protein